MTAIQLPAAVLPPPGDAPLDPDSRSRYIGAVRLEMLAFDLIAFAVLALLTVRLFPRKSAWERGERLLLYLLGTALLGHLLYNRLDIVMAALVLLAAALLLSRVHFFWSFVALAAAVNFKLVPIVLLPVWVLGSLPATWPQPGGFLRSLPSVLGRSALLAALIAALFVPFWLVGGSHTLEFLSYHKDRGLEVESTYSAALMCLRPFGLALAIEDKYGSYNLLSSLSPRIAQASGPITAALVAAASLGLTWLLARRRGESRGGERRWRRHIRCCSSFSPCWCCCSWWPPTRSFRLSISSGWRPSWRWRRSDRGRGAWSFGASWASAL